MSTLPTLPPPATIGCDVGKREIVVCHEDGRILTVPNQPEALARFAATLPPEALVICEATGGHEGALLNALVEARRQVHRADARKVKAFIRSFGILGKTDAIDAKALAAYGRERHAQLSRWQPPQAGQEQLASLVAIRAELMVQKTAWSNRRKAPGAGATTPIIDDLLDLFCAKIKIIDAKIDHLIRAHQPLDRDAKALKSISCIGHVVATGLLALMPELGHLNRKTAAALAGLAPHPRQSGSRDGYRATRGGRPQVKRLLFMAALVAARHNPSLKAVYDRLVHKGKKPIVALTALMRKIIVIANATLKNARAIQVS